MRIFPGKIFIAAAVILIAALFACGDDDKIVDPGIPTEGELTDEQFMFAEEFLQSNIVGTTEISLLTSMFLLMSLNDVTIAKEAPEIASSRELYMVYPTIVDTPSISPEGWYVFEFESVAMYADMDSIVITDIDSVTSVGLDSIRLLDDGAPVEWSSMGTMFDVLEYRYVANWESSRGASGVSRHSVELGTIGDQSFGFSEANIAIMDTLQTPLTDDGGFCYVKQYVSATATDVLLEFSMDIFDFGYCADSGFVVGTAVVELDCTSQAEAPAKGFEGVWQFEGEFDSEYILSYRLTHGLTYWLAADTCELSDTY